MRQLLLFWELHFQVQIYGRHYSWAMSHGDEQQQQDSVPQLSITREHSAVTTKR